jgi:surface protein
MFEGCSSLTTLDLSNFNTESLTYVRSMFKDCNSLLSIKLPDFDEDELEDVQYMFDNCNSLFYKNSKLFSKGN